MQVTPVENVKAVWPPTHEIYEALDSDQIEDLLERESNNTLAPESYRNAMKSMLREFSHMKGEATAVQSKNALYAKYVRAAEANCNKLTTLYKEEHNKVLDQQETILQLETKLKIAQEANEQAKKIYDLQLDGILVKQRESVEKLAQEYAKTAHKQAQGRKNIEEKLMYKDMENSELKKKIVELETLVVELDRYKSENMQIRQLLNYLKNPQAIQQVHTLHQQQPPSS